MGYAMKNDVRAILLAMEETCLNFKKSVMNCADRVCGNHVVDIRQLRRHDLLFVLSETKEFALAVSLDPVKPLMTTITLDFEWQALPKAGVGPLRNHLLRAKIDQISALEDDAIVVMSGHRKNELYQLETWELHVELFKKHPNMVLTESGIIKYAAKTYGLEQTRPLLPGLTYENPSASGFHKKRAYDQDEIEYRNNISGLVLAEQAQPLLKKLRSRQSQLRRKVEGIKEDMANWQSKLSVCRIADVLIAHEDKARHLPYVEIDGALIPLDPALTLGGNAQKMYRQYRKAKLAQQPLWEQLRQTENELSVIDELLAQGQPGSEYELEALRVAMEAWHLTPHVPSNKTKQPQQNWPYYVIIDDIRYSFGRSATQNDFLTFNLAKPQEWFFHIHRYPGAHVICHYEEPTPEMKQTAASLALLLSRRPEGEVAFAQVKTVKRGSNVGMVIMKNYELLLIKNIETALASTLLEAKRHQR